MYRQYLLVIDEVVEGKSRSKTDDLGSFWSSIQKRPIKGICLFVGSLISLSSKRLYVLAGEQVG